MSYYNPIDPNTSYMVTRENGINIEIKKANAPFSDDMMKWNPETNMYYITPKGFENATGLPVSAFLPETYKNEIYETFLLKEVSERVYEIIMTEHGWINNKLHYLRLAFDRSLRPAIKRVLLHASENTLKTQKLLLGDQHMLTGYTANRSYDDQSLHLQRLLDNNGIRISAQQKIIITETETLPDSDWENGWVIDPKAGE